MAFVLVNWFACKFKKISTNQMKFYLIIDQWGKTSFIKYNLDQSNDVFLDYWPMKTSFTNRSRCSSFSWYVDKRCTWRQTTREKAKLTLSPFMHDVVFTLNSFAHCIMHERSQLHFFYKQPVQEKLKQFLIINFVTVSNLKYILTPNKVDIKLRRFTSMNYLFVVLLSKLLYKCCRFATLSTQILIYADQLLILGPGLSCL